VLVESPGAKKQKTWLAYSVAVTGRQRRCIDSRAKVALVKGRGALPSMHKERETNDDKFKNLKINDLLTNFAIHQI